MTAFDRAFADPDIRRLLRDRVAEDVARVHPLVRWSRIAEAERDAAYGDLRHRTSDKPTIYEGGDK